MPIYAYRCASCGHAQDVLQKISDPLLSRCPACGAETFAKQLTAAGFQLKGSGWYATDFRNGGQGNGSGAAASSASAPAANAPAESAAAASGSSGSSTEASATPCGGSCACH